MLPKGAGGAGAQAHHDPEQITSLPGPQLPSGERQGSLGQPWPPGLVGIAEMRSSVDALWTETIETVHLFKTVLMLSPAQKPGRPGPAGSGWLQGVHGVSHQEGRGREGVHDGTCPESVAIYRLDTF